MSKVIFVGAGPGDPELITVKGRKALENADVIIYAGSLVPSELLSWARPGAILKDSAGLTFDEVTAVYADSVGNGKAVVRLHSGDPSIYGAIQEQIDWLDDNGFDVEIIPGVTAAFAAAAAVKRELTAPEISQAVVFCRAAGRTAVPKGQDIESIAGLGATICLYLSVHMADAVAVDLLKHYPPETPTAIVYHASRADQLICRGALADLPELVESAGIKSTAVVLIGPALAGRSKKSKLYDKEFSHGRRG